MPTVKLVPEDSKDPIVAKVFADIKETKKIDFIPTGTKKATLRGKEGCPSNGVWQVRGERESAGG